MNLKNSSLLVLVSLILISCTNVKRFVSKANLSNVYDSLKVLPPLVFVNELEKGDYYNPKDPSNLINDLKLQLRISEDVFLPVLSKFSLKEGKKLLSVDSSDLQLIRYLLFNNLKEIDEQRKFKRTLFFYFAEDEFHKLFLKMFALQSATLSCCSTESIGAFSQKYKGSKFLFYNVFYIHNSRLDIKFFPIDRSTPTDMLPDEIISLGVYDVDTKKIEYILTEENSIHPSNSYSNRDTYEGMLYRLKERLLKY